MAMPGRHVQMSSGDIVTAGGGRTSPAFGGASEKARARKESEVDGRLLHSLLQVAGESEEGLTQARQHWRISGIQLRAARRMSQLGGPPQLDPGGGDGAASQGAEDRRARAQPQRAT